MLQVVQKGKRQRAASTEAMAQATRVSKRQQVRVQSKAAVEAEADDAPDDPLMGPATQVRRGW